MGFAYFNEYLLMLYGEVDVVSLHFIDFYSAKKMLNKIHDKLSVFFFAVNFY